MPPLQKFPQKSPTSFSDSINDKRKIQQKNLSLILSESVWASVTQNIAEKFIVPFALILKASSFSVGVLSTFPQLAGAIAQLLSVKVLHSIGSRKKMICAFLFFQALLWLPLFLVPFLFSSLGVLSIIICFSIYYIIGGIYTPAWSSWVSTIVPDYARGRFYGKKNQISGCYGFLAAVLGGYLLHIFAGVHIWLAYGILFFIAMITKFFTLLFILQMEECSTQKESQQQIFQKSTFLDFLRHINKTLFGRYVFYMCCMCFAVNLAAPYFTLYILTPLSDGGLGWSYLQFAVITAVASCAGFFVFRQWGAIADRFGNKRVLVFTGLLIPFVPLLWIFSTNYYYLILIEIFSGIAWAGFNLTSANYVFDLVGAEKRIIYLAYYNSLTTLSVFIGALAGSSLKALGPLLGIEGIIFLFTISFLVRFVVALFFFTRLRELREVEGYHFFQELAIHPVQGFTHGAFQHIHDSFIHFKRKHMRDIIKIERYIDEGLVKK